MIIREARFHRGITRWEELPEPELPEVAFIGRSNVGKSTLVNMLVERKGLALTSQTPGKTRQFNFFRINGNLYFVDVPGFGYAQVARTERERWAWFIRQYLVERDPLKLVVHLVDSRHEPTELDKDVMRLMKESRAAYLIVLTKTDKLSGNGRAKAMASVNRVLAGFGMEVPAVHASFVEQRGRKEIWQWIALHTGVPYEESVSQAPRP